MTTPQDGPGQVQTLRGAGLPIPAGGMTRIAAQSDAVLSTYPLGHDHRLHLAAGTGLLHHSKDAG